MAGKIYMIPMTLGAENAESVMPAEALSIVKTIRYFLVENIRTARRYLILLGMKEFQDEIVYREIDKHNPDFDYSVYFKEVKEGKDLGVISEAGCPGVADPGSTIVAAAHRNNLQVIPLIGPSSILLSLMASGLNGQSFAFVGYLPIKNPERAKEIRRLEDLSKKYNQTQIFIETPYRNNILIDNLTDTCSPSTMLCIACDITLKSEYIKTAPVQWWKQNKPDINKRPAIFLILKK